jgi:long-chain acyl-CoA synthetase
MLPEVEDSANARTGHGAATLIWRLAANAGEIPERVAMRERDLGIWQEYTWREYFDHVTALAAGIEDLGFHPFDALLVIGDNRPRLYFAMAAAMMLQGFAVPAFPEAPSSELERLSNKGLARIAVAEDQEQVDKLLELRASTGSPEHIIYDDSRGLAHYSQPGLHDMEAVLAAGRERLAANPGLVRELVGRAQPEDGAVLIHSSGTTGTPKGILLRHNRVLAAIRNAVAADYVIEGENFMAYLPLAWVGDWMNSLATAIAMRCTVNIPERPDTVLRNIREVAPNVYFASPRSWDSMLGSVQVGIAESTPLKRWLFHYFTDVAVEIERDRIGGRKPSAWRRLQRTIGEVLIYGPVKDHLGLSHARHAYTAGEAIGEDTFLFFRALGLDLKQFYGQSECCGFTSSQTSENVKLHTVGCALPGVELRISDDGEILVRSESVFDGYYNDPEASAKALVDGWLCTGDAGYLEPDGQLVVLGRVAEVVRTSAGERFIPGFIENRLKFSQYVRDAAVIGAGRNFIAAIICIDMEAVGHWAQSHGVFYTSYADLSQKPQVRDLVAGVVRHVNELQPPPLRIKRVVNLHKEFDPDDGEVTRTRKLRRNVIDERYAEVIDALYDGRNKIDFEVRITYETGAVGHLRRDLTLMTME